MNVDNGVAGSTLLKEDMSLESKQPLSPQPTPDTSAVSEMLTPAERELQQRKRKEFRNYLQKAYPTVRYE